jgi:hypothetical protein
LPRSAISAGTTFSARWSVVTAADVIVTGGWCFGSFGSQIASPLLIPAMSPCAGLVEYTVELGAYAVFVLLAGDLFFDYKRQKRKVGLFDLVGVKEPSRSSYPYNPILAALCWGVATGRRA